MKCDWPISFIQVGRNITHPIFQKLYHPNIYTSTLYEFAILYSQTSLIIQAVLYILFKAGLTLNDLYDTICMTHNRFSNFHCVYTIIQVVHAELIKVVLMEYSALKSSSKMIQELAAAAIIIALISEKNKSRKKRGGESLCVKPWLKRKKNLEFYETLLVKLLLKEEYNYNILSLFCKL